MTILLNMTKGMHTDRDLATAKNVQFGNNLANKFSRHIEKCRIKLTHVAEIQELTAPSCVILASYKSGHTITVIWLK